jgi:hypothetical protein
VFPSLWTDWRNFLQSNGIDNENKETATTEGWKYVRMYQLSTHIHIFLDIAYLVSLGGKLLQT